MCLSTVYIDVGNEQKEIMNEVAQIEAEGAGFWFSDLFGKKKFVEGSIKTVNLMDGFFVIISPGLM